jgi:ATP phosphoribosyltransferase regulatory subunit
MDGSLHPLPAGMRDLLPIEARRQSSLAGRVIESFELYGYERVTMPAFEYASVLERGLGALDANEVLRFVEPETGEVVALRPDMTTQVARMLAARLADAPPPARLCYEGSVLRRRRERARRNRQIAQAGIELVGTAGPAGDLEVLTVAAAAVRAAGLERCTIDLGHARIAWSLLEPVPREHWPALVEALALKDAAELELRAARAGVQGAALAALCELPSLHGSGDALWKRAERVLGATGAAQSLAELRALWQAATELGPELVVDLGETWNFAYYTGMTFQILAEGPGAAVGSGGRYDGLLERFGVARPAAGFAVDLDNLGWALDHGEAHENEPARLLVVKGDGAAAVMRELRAEGVRCATAPNGDALGYARAWRYTHVLEVGQKACKLSRVVDGNVEKLEAAEQTALAARVRARLESDTLVRRQARS